MFTGGNKIIIIIPPVHKLFISILIFLEDESRDNSLEIILSEMSQGINNHPPCKTTHLLEVEFLNKKPGYILE